jgi:hypothetical protein
VLDAFLGDCEHTGLQMDDLRENVAAALRAAADQMVPKEPDLSPEEASDLVIWGKWRQRTRTRAQLLAIAAELETSTTENR